MLEAFLGLITRNKGVDKDKLIPQRFYEFLFILPNTSIFSHIPNLSKTMLEVPQIEGNFIKDFLKIARQLGYLLSHGEMCMEHFINSSPSHYRMKRKQNMTI